MTRRRLVRSTGILADQKADRDELADLIAPMIGPYDRRWAEKVAHAILDSDWLAALIEREHGKAVAPIHALADEWEAEPLRWGHRWTDALRAVLGDPAAATTHDRAVAAQALRDAAEAMHNGAPDPLQAGYDYGIGQWLRDRADTLDQENNQ